MMSPLLRWTIAAALAANAAVIAAAGAASMEGATGGGTDEQRIDQMREALVTGVNGFVKNLDTPKADGTTRTYTYAAHDALALGMEAKVAEDLVRRAMARQNMDASSPSYGDVPWQMFANDIHDANSVEFTFNSVGPIMLGYAQKLSPQFVAEMKPHIAAGIIAVRRHKVEVGYTNIYLMKTENLLLLGQAIGDQGAMSDGRQQLETWLKYTASHGIHEYSSPTYASVQLDCLLKAYRFTQQPDVQAELKAALDYLWSDAAASYCPACEGMGGAHSREYDFLRGTGPIDRFYWLVGLRSEQPLSSLFSDGYMSFLNAVEKGYEPSDEILSMANMLPRAVKAKWDDAAGKDRYTYITSDFSVGSSSAWYGAQDRQVAVDLGPASAAPVAMTLSADTFDAPYGKETVKDRSGHNKPHRLKTDIASVQDGGAVLALLNLSPELAKTPAGSVATDLLVPLVADEIVIDGKTVQIPDEAKSLAQAAAGGPLRLGRSRISCGIGRPQRSATACWGFAAETRASPCESSPPMEWTARNRNIFSMRWGAMGGRATGCLSISGRREAHRAEAHSHRSDRAVRSLRERCRPGRADGSGSHGDNRSETRRKYMGCSSGAGAIIERSKRR